MTDNNTCISSNISDDTITNYINSLVNKFFKILPLRESGEQTLPRYLESLQRELLGVKSLIGRFGYDHNLLTLLAILEFLINNPDCPVPVVKTEVFRAIGICGKLSDIRPQRGGDSV